MRPSSPKPLFLWALRSFSRGISRSFREWPVAVRPVATPKLKAGPAAGSDSVMDPNQFSPLKLIWVHRSCNRHAWPTKLHPIVFDGLVKLAQLTSHLQPWERGINISSPFAVLCPPLLFSVIGCFWTWCREESGFWTSSLLKTYIVASETELSEES